MDLHQDAVRAGGDGRQAHTLDQVPLAGAVARVDDDGEVGEALGEWYGRQIERVAGRGLEGLDAPLAQNDLSIPLAHDVLGRHDPLFHGAARSALEEDRLVGAPHFVEQGIVLAVARADLEDVGILADDADGARLHHLGDDGEAGERPGFGEEAQPLLTEPLERVRR